MPLPVKLCSTAELELNDGLALAARVAGTSVNLSALQAARRRGIERQRVVVR